MKKRLGIIFICLFLAVGFVFATEDGVINVSFNSIKTVSPNEAKVVVAVETFNTNLQKAVDENNKASGAVYAGLKGLINPKNGDYVKTLNYTVTPVYTYKNNKQTLDKYKVINQVTAYTKDINIVNKFVDVALASGANRVENLEYSVSNTDEICDKMLNELTIKSKNRAEKIANVMGIKNVTVKSISTNCSTENRVTRNYAMKTMLLDSASGSSVPTEAGLININANINAAFFVK